MGLLPPSRPQVQFTNILAWLRDAGFAFPDEEVFLVGRRGYYRDTMGKPGVQERGLYDDAIVIVEPSGVQAFNANCDPGYTRVGIAQLKAGVWRYKLGTHHPGTPDAYPCLVQAAPVTVKRDGGVTETGEFYIHIHRGGWGGVSSLGCQTIYPAQWDGFFAAVKALMRQYKQRTIPYLLTDRN